MNRLGDTREYLDTYGEMTREMLPYGEVDYMILSALVYAPLENLLGDDRGKRLQDLCPLIWKDGYTGETSRNRMDLWMKAAYLPRYASLTLDMFVSITDKETEEQFAAAVFADGQDAFLVFRGTDRTTIGWKEDFNMSYMDEVPSERHAAKMLEGIASFYSSVTIMGHSKGGILAVYSAYKVSSVALEHVASIWSFDGPGLPSSYTGGSRWEKVSALTHAFIPESSVVGIIFTSLAKQVVVRTRSIGILQHDPLTWRIVGNEFDTLEDTSLHSKLMKIAIKNVLECSTAEERSTIVDSIYAILDSTGTTNLKDLPSSVIRKRTEMKEALDNMPEKAREALAALAHILWDGRHESLEAIEHRIPFLGRDE